MSGSGRLAELKPLWVGRLSRALAGLASLALVFFVEWEGLAWIGAVVLVFLGLSFLIGALMANPGCELTALPNLVLPSRKKVHFV